MPTKANPTTKEQSCKWGTTGASDAGGIKIILAVLGGLLGGLRVRDDGLERALLGAGVPCSEESPRASESLSLANRGFLREQNAIAAEQSLVV